MKKKKNSIEKVNVIELQNSSMDYLHGIAKSLNIVQCEDLKKHDLIFKILEKNMSQGDVFFSEGILDVLPEGFGFVRAHNYLPSSDDIYVSQFQIRQYGLRTGDIVLGKIRPPKDVERYFAFLEITKVNGDKLCQISNRPLFSSLVPLYPKERLVLESKSLDVSTRLIDMIAPIGKGQRALIVSPPKAGKTTLLKNIANSIAANYPDVVIKVLLIDERPEEVTDMERSIDGEIVYSTFDEPPEQHVKISELVLDSAKRLVEGKKDVVILLDSITRLARAYNLVVHPSGRTLSGGLDPASLYKPKRFFGGARNIEDGGSLTIIATALVDTGSRMDDIIYEEFKGTGNMELHLDRRLANRRIYPAIDVVSSGTRKEELLFDEETLQKVFLLRKNLDSANSIEELIRLLGQTKTNQEFFDSPIFL